MNKKKPVRIWSISLRAFHWILVVSVVANFYTGKFGDGVDSMEWHERFGLGILALLLFRFFWGLWGDQSARFTYFVPGPKTLFTYLTRTIFERHPSNAQGHSPSAAMGALTLLASLLVQALSGLFATDDIVTEGPLCRLVSSSSCSIASQIHFYNTYVLSACIVAHLGALAFYGFYKREALIPAMVTGKKAIDASVADHQPQPKMAPLWLGLISFLLAILCVWVAVYAW